jgi:hypothetical protein
MPGNLGPPGPEVGEGRLPGEPANVEKVVTSHSSPSPTPTTAKKQKPAHSHYITGRRHIGLYASGWRDGFSAGAADALRLAAREIDDPHAWAMLDRPADRYGDRLAR